MSRNAELHGGEVIVRRQDGRITTVRVQLDHRQHLTWSVTVPDESGRAQHHLRKVQVSWKQGPLDRDPSVVLGYAVIDLRDLSAGGLHGEDLTDAFGDSLRGR